MKYWGYNKFHFAQKDRKSFAWNPTELYSTVQLKLCYFQIKVDYKLSFVTDSADRLYQFLKQPNQNLDDVQMHSGSWW